MADTVNVLFAHPVTIGVTRYKAGRTYPLAPALAERVVNAGIGAYADGDDPTPPTGGGTGGTTLADLAAILRPGENIGLDVNATTGTITLSATGGADLPPDMMDRLLPTDGDPAMMMVRASADEPGYGKWVERDPLGRYRGPWGPDEAIALYDFSSGTIAPLTAVYEGNATAANTAVGASPLSSAAGGSVPPYGFMAAVTGSTANGSVVTASGIEIDLTAILNGRVATRVRYYDALFRNATSSGMAAEFLGDGGVRATETFAITQGTYRAWRENTVPLNGAKLLRWRVRHTVSTASGTGNRLQIAGVRIYAAAQPYLFGDVVDHLGSFYRSEVDNNSTTPGETGAAWTLVAT